MKFFFFIASYITLLFSITAADVLLSSEYKFATSLFSEKDYYRAHIEYLRSAYLTSDNELRSLSYLRAAESAYLGNQFDDAAETLAKVSRKHYHQHVFWLSSYINAKDKDFHNYYEYKEDNSYPLYQLQQTLWKIQLHAQENKPSSIVDKLTALPWKTVLKDDSYAVKLQGDLPDKTSYISDLKMHWPAIETKSRWLAAGLSALLPGLGQAYSHRWFDALSSFVVVSALAVTGALSYSTNEKSLSYILFGLTGVFYAGNIYGGLVAADNYNLQRTKDFSTTLRKVDLRYQVLRF